MKSELRSGRSFLAFPHPSRHDQEPENHAAYGIGWMADTSCMKAHVVKWGVFLSYVFLLATFLRSRIGHGWLEDRLFASPFCGFCSSSWLSSSCGFVRNHVLAVAAGMSLC